MKTKLERQTEARARKLLSLPQRKARLLLTVQDHHDDVSNKWTLKRLQQQTENFSAFLREIDLPWGNDSFFVFREKVMLIGEKPPVYGAPHRQCVYCLARFGKNHASPCDPLLDVERHDAIYKDC